MKNLYVFRIAYWGDGNTYAKSELKQGRLRQGWGGKGTSLLENSSEQWIEKKCLIEQFEGNSKYYAVKYRSMRLMLDIKPGDIIIIPKTPEYSQFTICKAGGCYCFDDSPGYKWDDFQHYIPIDVSSIREYNYHANEFCKIIRAKMRAYQNPVNNVWNDQMIEAAEKLLSGESDYNVISTADSVHDILGDILPYSEIQRFRNLGNREIEKIVAVVFEKMGYECIQKNSYDRKGGDADLIFRHKDLNDLFDVAENDTDVSNEIYVQVKNKTGTDNSDIDGVNQLITRTKDIPGATKILISTADSFTEACAALARENNVLLINGKGFMRLVFKSV